MFLTAFLNSALRVEELDRAARARTAAIEAQTSAEQRLLASVEEVRQVRAKNDTLRQELASAAEREEALNSQLRVQSELVRSFSVFNFIEVSLLTFVCR